MAAYRYVDRFEEIPKNFKSYCLFLIPSEHWLKKEQYKAVGKLWELFVNFGRAIGEDNLAVWFIEYEESKLTDPIPILKHDISLKKPKNGKSEYKMFSTDYIRSKNYCDKFNLNYNDGPYIIFTETHPDKSSTEDILCIKFNNISPDRIIKFINDLEKDIRAGKKPTKPFSVTNYVYERCINFWDTNKDTFKEIAIGLISGKIGSLV